MEWLQQSDADVTPVTFSGILCRSQHWEGALLQSCSTDDGFAAQNETAMSHASARRRERHVRRLREAVDRCRERGEYLRATMLCVRAIRIADRLPASDCTDLFPLLLNLGGLCQCTRRFSEAAAIYRRALRLARLQCGAQHPAVAIVYHHLASLECARGRSRRGQVLYEHALIILERADGIDPFDVPRLVFREGRHIHQSQP